MVIWIYVALLFVVTTFNHLSTEKKIKTKKKIGFWVDFSTTSLLCESLSCIHCTRGYSYCLTSSFVLLQKPQILGEKFWSYFPSLSAPSSCWSPFCCFPSPGSLSRGTIYDLFTTQYPYIIPNLTTAVCGTQHNRPWVAARFVCFPLQHRPAQTARTAKKAFPTCSCLSHLLPRIIKKQDSCYSGRTNGFPQTPERFVLLPFKE